jgi:hypothetical protein
MARWLLVHLFEHPPQHTMAIDSGGSDNASVALFPPEDAAFKVLESMLGSQHSKVIELSADVEEFLAWLQKEKEEKQQKKPVQVTLTLALTLALALTLTPVQVGLVPGQKVRYKGSDKTYTIAAKGKGQDAYTVKNSSEMQYLSFDEKDESWSTVDSPKLSEKKEKIKSMQCTELRNNLEGYGHRKETVGKVKKVELTRMLQVEVCKRKKEHVY